MTVYRNIRFLLLRFIRHVLDFITSSVFGFLYGKSKVIPPIDNDVLLLPATVLAEKIRTKQLKSVDVVSAYITRIKDLQPIINGMAESRFNGALEEGRKVDDLIASGSKTEEELQKSMPILGVPFTIKEHIAVKYMHCTKGLVASKDCVSNEDAEIVSLMKKAGGIFLATTNTPELCLWWEAENKLYGITTNPYDTRRTCGGSSGGEGALIGAAGSVVGIGSDLAGSIRIPAAFNGVFGHKPSSGVVPLFGAVNVLPDEAKEIVKYVSLGPMCRYATDLLPLTKIITSNNPRLNLDLPVNLRNLKIYYSDDIGDCPMATPVSKDVEKAMKMALNHFHDNFGIKPTRVQFQGMGDSVRMWNSVLRESNPPTFVEVMSNGKCQINVMPELIKWCFRMSDHTLHTVFNAFMELYAADGPKRQKEHIINFKKLQTQFNDILKDDCVFLFPTQPHVAPFRHETLSKVWDIGYTSIFNILMYPVTHVPMILSNGLPVGIQCAANLNNDRLTIAVASELEKAYGGWTSPSPIRC